MTAVPVLQQTDGPAMLQATLWVEDVPEFTPWEQARPDQLPEAWRGLRRSSRVTPHMRANGSRLRAVKRAPATATRCVGQVPLGSLDAGLVEAAAGLLAEAKRQQIHALPVGTAIPVDGFSRPGERGQ